MSAIFVFLSQSIMQCVNVVIKICLNASENLCDRANDGILIKNEKNCYFQTISIRSRI